MPANWLILRLLIEHISESMDSTVLVVTAVYYNSSEQHLQLAENTGQCDHRFCDTWLYQRGKYRRFHWIRQHTSCFFSSCIGHCFEFW